MSVYAGLTRCAEASNRLSEARARRSWRASAVGAHAAFGTFNAGAGTELEVKGQRCGRLESMARSQEACSSGMSRSGKVALLLAAMAACMRGSTAFLTPGMPGAMQQRTAESGECRKPHDDLLSFHSPLSSAP